MSKWLTALFYLIICVLAYAYKDQLSTWMQSRPSVVMMVLASMFFALFPVMPYKLVIAAIGFVYGAWWGGLICLIGSTLAGALFYVAGAYWFKEGARRWLARYPKLGSLSRFVEAHPFQSIVVYRIIPVLPQGAINLYAGVSSISFWVFIIASLIGKTPGVFVYAFLGTSLFKQPVLAASVLIGYILVIGLFLWGYRRLSLRWTNNE